MWGFVGSPPTLSGGTECFKRTGWEINCGEKMTVV